MAGPFEREHIYVQWGGTLPGSETWSCGIRMAPAATLPILDGLPDPAALQTILGDHIGPAVQVFHTKMETGISGAAKLSFVKANVIGIDGHYKEQTTLEVVYPNVAGNKQGNPMPNQCTMCVSTTTTFSRGPAHRGRFYLPLPVVQPDATTGLVPAAFANDLADAAWAFITELNDWPTGAGINSPICVVMSRKLNAPATRVITGVEVGRVVDTQRRRRRSLPELYEGAGA